MVSLLKPGDDYAKIVQIIEAVPNAHEQLKHEQLKSGRIIYQFDRSWEYIDLLVSRDSVLSIGIYAKNSDFKPILDEGGKSITLNGQPISHQTSYSSVLGASGECGGSSGGYYYEGYSLPHVYNFGSYLLGWEIPGSLMPDTVCLVVSPSSQCSKDTTASLTLSMNLFNCITNSKEGRSAQTTLSPSVVILVKPGNSILPDMWNYAPLA